MKEIIIKENNRNRINEEIKAAEGRAAVRTIGYTDISEAIGKIERTFSFAQKKDLEGLEVICDVYAQKYPGAYKYSPASTFFKVRYSKGSWRLVWVERREQSKNCDLEFTVVSMPGTLMNAITYHYLYF